MYQYITCTYIYSNKSVCESNMSQILCKCHCRYVLEFVYVTIIKCNIVVHVDIFAKLWIPVLLFHVYFFWVFIYLFVWQKGVGREFISLRYTCNVPVFSHCCKTLNSSVVIPNLFLHFSLILCSFVLFWIWGRENLPFSVSVPKKKVPAALYGLWMINHFSFCANGVKNSIFIQSQV